MSMVRSSFRGRREGYTDKAVFIRCLRKDQSSATLKLYYLLNGRARLGFWLQGKEYLLPVGIVLKDLSLTTHLQCLHHRLLMDSKAKVTMLFVLQKLFLLVDYTSVSDNPDSLQNQEILLPGQLIPIYLKDRDRKLRTFPGSEHPFGNRPLETYAMPPRRVRELQPHVRRTMIGEQENADMQQSNKDPR